MNRGRLARVLVAAGLLGVATAGAKAATFVPYDSGSVVIMTEGRQDGGPGASHVIAASGSLQFDAVADPNSGGCCAHAEEHYSLGPTGISASGNISTGGFNSDAQSILRVEWEVSEVTPFHLDGSVDGYGYSTFADAIQLHVLSGPFSFSGLLEPGVLYDLELAVVSLNGSTPSSGQYQVTLAVPEPSRALLGLTLLALALARRTARPDASTAA